MFRLYWNHAQATCVPQASYDFMNGKYLNALKRSSRSKSLCLPFLLSSGETRWGESRTVWASFYETEGKSSYSTHLRLNFKSARCSSLPVTFLTDCITQSLYFLLKLQITLSPKKETAMISISTDFMFHLNFFQVDR